METQNTLLILSWRRSLSYRNRPINLRSKSMDWFLFDKDLRHERFKRPLRYCFRARFRSEAMLKMRRGIWLRNFQSFKTAECWWRYVFTLPNIYDRGFLRKQLTAKQLYGFWGFILFRWWLVCIIQICDNQKIRFV